MTQLLTSSSSYRRVSDAVSDFLPVLRVSRVLQDALHHRRERQTHQRHGLSRVRRAGHQRPGTTGQLLLHAGHTGTECEILKFTEGGGERYPVAVTSRRESETEEVGTQQRLWFWFWFWFSLCSLQRYVHEVKSISPPAAVSSTEQNHPTVTINHLFNPTS